MKRNKVIATLLASLFIAVSASAILAPGGAAKAPATEACILNDTMATQNADSITADEVKVRPAAINMLARSYGDSIVLRWAPEDYVTWNYLNHVGYNLYRIYTDKSGVLHDDLIAEGIRPLSLEQLRARYPESDSLAFVAVGMIYGEALSLTRHVNATERWAQCWKYTKISRRSMRSLKWWQNGAPTWLKPSD